MLLVLAAQAAASTPSPTPTPAPNPGAVVATPVPTPTPVAAADPWKPRGLSEVARERRLGHMTTSGAAVVTTPEPEPAPSGTPALRRAELVRVEDVQDNGAVTDGFVSIYGSVRNASRASVCHVRILLRMYDDHGVLLSTGETTTDLKIVAPGEAVPFGGTVKAPAGLRGSKEPKPDPLAGRGAATNWQRVGRVEAEIASMSGDCS
jgi:hypothetical protein